MITCQKCRQDFDELPEKHETLDGELCDGLNHLVEEFAGSDTLIPDVMCPVPDCLLKLRPLGPDEDGREILCTHWCDIHGLKRIEEEGSNTSIGVETIDENRCWPKAEFDVMNQSNSSIESAPISERRQPTIAPPAKSSKTKAEKRAK
jgi:hypothetical protein